MKVENIRTVKSTFSGDTTVFRRGVHVFQGRETGGLKLQVALPTGSGYSWFTFDLDKVQGREFEAAIKAVRDAEIDQLHNRVAKIERERELERTERELKKLEEA